MMDNGMPAFADGGSIGGFSPHSKADNILIAATAGEFMHPVSAVQKYGINFMESIRTLRFPLDISSAFANINLSSSPSSYRLAEGGTVPSGSPTFKGGDTRIKVINVLDKNLVGDYLRTSDGDTSLINSIKRNSSVLRTILGR
jgi:hypothetical protein